jgi:serine/threonine protein kinase/tetratricopeptide (TPR) repeat protein
MNLTVGARLGPYEITGLIGAGGMGEVYRARDTRLGRDVAVKVLPAEFADDPDRLRRFEQEARAVAALNHPNILVVHDVGTHEGAPYLVTELLEGESLRTRLHVGALPVSTAIDFADQMARGLAAAHEKGIVHRDLKPENLFLTRLGCVKILDFGLAKLLRSPQEVSAASTVAGVTQPGTIMGTAAYMSPEQIRGQEIDHRADIFAFGCVLYEMLSGEQPFPGTTAADTLAAILTRDPRPLVDSQPEVPAALELVVLRCLEKRPEDRFDTARDVAFALTAAAQPRKPPGAVDRRPPVQELPSIAVLPPVNLSADPEQEYFCDGIAEEIINALAHVEGLRVVARTSSFAFKGRAKDIRDIGRSLDVSTVLEGSVRRAGDRLRVTAQLINVADGYHLWSERFDRRLEDVFAIQDEIALAIVENLKVKLLSGEKVSLVRGRAYNLEAYDAFLKGRFEWNKMSPEGFARCYELFREAIRLDPELAPAYAQLADSMTSPSWWADQPPTEALAHAIPLAERALALDPNLAHGHSVLGHCQAFFERNRVAGERSLRRAAELAPNDALAQTYLGLFLMALGGGEEAVGRARLALRLDPLSPAVQTWAGTILVFSGQPAEGLRTLEEQIARTPQFWMPHYFLGTGLGHGGRLLEARTVAETARELSGDASVTLSLVVCLCHLLGDRKRAEEAFQSLRQRAEAGYVTPMLLAWAHLARGETEQALHRVEEALAAKDPWVNVHRLYSPAIAPAEPRVDALIAASFT